ncbi:ABC transporter ATP-binding protein [Saccharothrix algeriensis]|uniref:ATP-binding cassette subfamily B protein n=2 Tax=Saccharothrix algeriensis TaxID=173560 RepID=A0ABS2SFJ7_9PSEU|nr:ABC transporter ATP-binding protein [Saccharothrix algeriensis]MBM7814744.1 ATP-binding cassette subfamily B protein [Saccharothrix algeriensis]
MRFDGRLLLTATRASGWHGAGIAVAALVEAGAALALPAVVARVVDGAIAGTPAPVWPVVVALALVTAAEAAAVGFERRAGVLGAVRLRRGLLRHLLALDVATARTWSTGDLLGRVLQSTTAAASATSAAIGLVVSLLTSLGGVVALVLVDGWLGVAVLAAAPVVLWLFRWLTRQVSANTGDYQDAFADLVTRFGDAVDGARTIRASGTLERETARVLDVVPRLGAAGARFWRIQRTAVWRSGLVMPALQVLVLAVGCARLVSGHLSVGELLAVQAYFGYATGLFRQNALLSRVARALGSAERVAGVLAESLPPAGRATLPAGGGAVELDDVGVVRGGRVLLDGVTLRIRPGQTVAVVGGTGSGKSTLAEVVGGLSRPGTGRVRLDGVDLAELSGPELRAAVTYAFERPVLLGATVADAIGYCDRPASAADVTAALRAAAAEDFVRRLPLGADTPLGDLRLSGGELQRLGLARALWREARLVVLDDATSSVDVVTEERITAALGAAMRTGTRLVVAHRVATARAADLVVWLAGGRVRAVAPHADLAADPDYRAVFTAPDLAAPDLAAPDPATPDPATPVPAAPEPAVPESAAPESAAAEPAAAESAAAESAAAEPARSV